MVVFLILFSLFIGSFLNVVALRVPRGESVVYPPSHCTTCKNRLRPFDLIPVVSYLFLRGTCRHCSARISPLYPAGELGTMLLFFLVFYHFGWSREVVTGWVFVALLLTVALSDGYYRLIPNKVIVPGMGLVLLLRIWHHPLPLSSYLIGFFIGGGLILIINGLSVWMLKKEGMGGGDMKLFALIGLALGWKLTLLSLVVSSFIGAVVGVLLLIGRKSSFGDYIPFAPSIAVGTVTVYLWGDSWLRWYFGGVFY